MYYGFEITIQSKAFSFHQRVLQDWFDQSEIPRTSFDRGLRTLNNWMNLIGRATILPWLTLNPSANYAQRCRSDVFTANSENIH